MNAEQQNVRALFSKLLKRPCVLFPPTRAELDAPMTHGVYIIRRGETVLHVGRSVRGQYGLRQRLYDHLHGSSSFTYYYLKGKGKRLRKGHSYQCLPIPNARMRALVESHAIGELCPKHLRTGK